jgi:hypothetical protein
MLHEDAKKATKDISKFPDGKKLEEASYGQ